MKYVIIFFLFLLAIGGGLYYVYLYEPPKQIEKELSYLPAKNEKELAEIFHALEIKEKDFSEKEEIKYLDYIIHKYKLWSPENLKRYIRTKQRLSTNKDKWEHVLRMAQDHQITPQWKEMYKEIETDSIEIYLDELEQKNPESHKMLTDFMEGDSEQAEKVFKKMFPNEQFPKDEWKNKAKEISKALLRTTLRNQFEQVYRKQSIYKQHILTD